MNSIDRLYKWDNVKTLLIFFVVFGHLRLFFAEPSNIMSYGSFWIYLFHMPAFVFVAGLFSRNTINNKCFHKIIPYLFLYLIMKALIFFSRVFVQGGMENLHFDLFYEDEIPWFAIAMFWWHLMAIGTSKVKPLYVIILSVVIVALSGYSPYVNSFLAINRTLVFFPFFYAGYIVDVNSVTRYLSNHKIRIVSWLLIFASLLFTFMLNDSVLYWKNLFKGCFSFSEIGTEMDVALGWVWRIVAYAISAIMMISIFAIVPRRRIVLMSEIGRRTLAIFALHIPLLIILLSDKYIIKTWLVSEHIACHCLLTALAVVLLLSIPVFDYLLRKIMVIPPRKQHATSSTE